MMNGAVFASLCAPSGDGLPYPEVPKSLERLVVKALEEAWKRVQLAGASELRQLGEDQTSVLLEEKLRELLDNEDLDGFTSEFFALAREPKVVNFDGNHPDKMPDFAFQLARSTPGTRSDYALHVECKRVGVANRLAPYYGREGMGCFIHGDYGCKMRSGLMVAYADSGYTFHDRLRPRLQKFLNNPRDSLATTQLPIRWLIPESHHQRGWTYANGQAPGNIRLLHVWLTIP